MAMAPNWWQRTSAAEKFGIAAAVSTVIGAVIGVLAYLAPPGAPGSSQASDTKSSAPTITAESSPAGASVLPSPSDTSPSPSAGSVVLSTLPLPPPQGQTGYVSATSVQIGTTTLPNSIRFTCSFPGFGSGSITYNVAGYKSMTSTIGVPNDATNGVGNSAKITFLKDGTTQLGTPLTIVVGRPQTIHLDLRDATQLQIQCAAKNSGNLGAAMDIALGDATLLP